MGRPNYKTVRHNKEIRERVEGEINSERVKRKKAAQRKAKEESIEYKIELAQRQCVQSLYSLEKEWEKETKAKVKDAKKIEEAREQILRGLDKAAADTMTRIMAEIKQVYLGADNIKIGEFQQVNLSIDDFYADFKKFLKREFVGYSVTEAEFEKIMVNYSVINIPRIKSLGKKFGYDKPAEQLQKNIGLVKKVAVKENELSF